MAVRRYAKLTTRLKGFLEPDTGSQFEDYLDKGTYLILDYRQNYPDSDTDYALVEAPVLGDGDTWICTRWKNSRYVAVEEKEYTLPVRLDFDDEFAIPESRLTDLLPDFHEFTYDLDRARYPYALRGYQVPQSPPQTNNCCTFAEALIAKAWQNEYDGFDWTREYHSQMMIFSADDYFSPITAVISANIGMPVENPDTPPHPWTLIQGWRTQWRSGHTFIIVDHHEATDRILTLESNSAYRLNGVGFRNIGNLRDVNGQPPGNWWEQEDLWTWSRIMSVYRYRQQARLKVRDRSWSGVD